MMHGVLNDKYINNHSDLIYNNGRSTAIGLKSCLNENKVACTLRLASLFLFGMLGYRFWGDNRTCLGLVASQRHGRIRTWNAPTLLPCVSSGTPAS